LNDLQYAAITRHLLMVHNVTDITAATTLVSIVAPPRELGELNSPVARGVMYEAMLSS
jgi:hypothetical protein